MPFLDSSIIIKLLDCYVPYTVSVEISGVKMILGGHPTNIHHVRILARKDPHAIKVFIYQLHHFIVKWRRLGGGASGHIGTRLRLFLSACTTGGCRSWLQEMRF